jgi:hypothetical protein
MARPGALMRRVLASNPTVNVSPWFQVCDRYSEGLAAMAQASCPLFVLGQPTRMTPPKAARRW